MSDIRLVPAAHPSVRFDRGYWQQRIAVNRSVTLPIQHRQLVDTGRLDSLRLTWKPGDPNKPHEFWDSDIAKWIEAASYSLATEPDADLRKHVDEAVDLLVASQQPDGYLNTHFTCVRPAERWTNLRDAHELYCAGHLIESAVAHHAATGDRKLLDALCRSADYIDAVFGPEEGKKRGYCGHPEIELALIRLYRATGEQRYLKLAKYFIDERGRGDPHYYDVEARARGQNPAKNWVTYEYYQAHRPVREQTDIEGHAVRALYLLAGMVDVAAETGDDGLMDACRRLFHSAVERRMYVTGGVGSQRHGERFPFDYALPNETAYAETCAAIALVFAAHRLLQVEPDRAYGDVMERALYNGIPSGVSLSGDTFLYANPLTVHRETLSQPARSHIAARRQEWFGCACCPPNVARLLASLGQYVYSTASDAVYVHLYASGQADLAVGEMPIHLRQETDYPWDGKIRLTVTPSAAAKFTLALRLPGWCPRPTVKVNGKRLKLAGRNVRRGYALIRRKWAPGDRVTLKLPMPAQRLVTNPRSRNNIGQVALCRGPMVYCIEETDNGADLHALELPRRARLRERFKPKLLGGVVALTAKARRIDPSGFGDELYRADPGRLRRKTCRLVATPYCTWGNRGAGEMRVWIHQTDG